MIRKILLPISLLMALALLAYCGDGAGKSSEPVGVGAGQPSIVQLQAVQQTAQTNSTISLKAKVLDGNGRALPNVPVIFTDLSSIGALSSNQAVTDTSGFATVSIFSAVPGFATVQAEVNSGGGRLRDKIMVAFSVFEITGVSVPTLTLAVDNNNDGSFNDPSDFIFFDPADPHDQAIVRATVLDKFGAPVLGDTVTFSADTAEATFPDGNEKQTNSEGQAFVRLKIVPSELRNVTVPLNVNAVSTSTGAFNVITLFIGPITIGQVTVTAPQSVASAGTSTVSAVVKTAAGTSVPDGTTVNFTTSKGTITPFAQTSQGVATATFTAPAITGSNQIATITASVGGSSGAVNVTVTASAPTPTPTPTPVPTLVVAPTTVSISCAAGTSATFFITGGKSPFKVTNSVSSAPLDVSAVSAAGSFTVATTANACTAVPGGSSTDFSVVVSDSSSPLQLVTVTVTVTNP